MWFLNRLKKSSPVRPGVPYPQPSYPPTLRMPAHACPHMLLKELKGGLKQRPVQASISTASFPKGKGRGNAGGLQQMMMPPREVTPLHRAVEREEVLMGLLPR